MQIKDVMTSFRLFNYFTLEAYGILATDTLEDTCNKIENIIIPSLSIRKVTRKRTKILSIDKFNMNTVEFDDLNSYSENIKKWIDAETNEFFAVNKKSRSDYDKFIVISGTLFAINDIEENDIEFETRKNIIIPQFHEFLQFMKNKIDNKHLDYENELKKLQQKYGIK